MKDFVVVIGAYKEESAGQLAELQETVDRLRLPAFLSQKDIESMPHTDIVTDATEVKVGDLNKLVLLDKERNPDLVAALRHLLAFGAKGMIVLFGNNDTRDYIRENKAYSAKELKTFSEELLRLLPLFGRRLA
ncbi:MAG: hypothetical protein IJ735_07100 [Clostridia bacterium]|nr:hypothetical protein [Clostridia bacterium]